MYVDGCIAYCVYCVLFFMVDAPTMTESLISLIDLIVFATIYIYINLHYITLPSRGVLHFLIFLHYKTVNICKHTYIYIHWTIMINLDNMLPQAHWSCNWTVLHSLHQSLWTQPRRRSGVTQARHWSCHWLTWGALARHSRQWMVARLRPAMAHHRRIWRPIPMVHPDCRSHCIWPICCWRTRCQWIIHIHSDMVNQDGVNQIWITTKRIHGMERQLNQLIILIHLISVKNVKSLLMKFFDVSWLTVISVMICEYHEYQIYLWWVGYMTAMCCICCILLHDACITFSTGCHPCQVAVMPSSVRQGSMALFPSMDVRKGVPWWYDCIDCAILWYEPRT